MKRHTIALAAATASLARLEIPKTIGSFPKSANSNDERHKSCIKPILTREMLAGTQPMHTDRPPTHSKRPDGSIIQKQGRQIDTIGGEENVTLAIPTLWRSATFAQGKLTNSGMHMTRA